MKNSLFNVNSERNSKFIDYFFIKIHYKLAIVIIIIFIFIILKIVKSKEGFDVKRRDKGISSDICSSNKKLTKNYELKEKLSIIRNKSLLIIGIMHKYLNDEEESIFFSLLQKGEKKSLIEYKKYYKLQKIAYNRVKKKGTDEEKELVNLIEKVKKYYKK